MQKWNSRVTYSPARVCKLWHRWHRWQLVKVVDAVMYFSCMDCLARRAEQHGRTAAKMDWVTHMTDSLPQSEAPRNPPPKRP
ncbi:hypothetical protein D3C73_283840 [compost metagenome]